MEVPLINFVNILSKYSRGERSLQDYCINPLFVGVASCIISRFTFDALSADFQVNAGIQPQMKNQRRLRENIICLGVGAASAGLSYWFF